MSASPPQLPPSVRFTGSLESNGPLVVAGRIEGAVFVAGLLVVAPSAVIVAEVRAQRVEVRGVVLGNISAEDAIILCASARVVGELRAPRVEVAG